MARGLSSTRLHRHADNEQIGSVPRTTDAAAACVGGEAIQPTEYGSKPMRQTRALLAVGAAVVLSATAFASTTPTGRRMELSTKSAEAKKRLVELQTRIENFQGGAESLELAKKIQAADPNFALGIYYLSAATPDQTEALQLYHRSRELAKGASEPERRFIDGMVYVR